MRPNASAPQRRQAETNKDKFQKIGRNHPLLAPQRDGDSSAKIKAVRLARKSLPGNVFAFTACNCWGSRLSSGLRTRSGPDATGKRLGRRSAEDPPNALRVGHQGIFLSDHSGAARYRAGRARAASLGSAWAGSPAVLARSCPNPVLDVRSFLPSCLPAADLPSGGRGQIKDPAFGRAGWKSGGSNDST
jgi:hypothetical protein